MAREQKSGTGPGHQALIEDRPHGIIIQMHALSWIVIRLIFT